MHETFEHTADLGLRIAAPTLPGLLAEAARGLFSIIVDNAQDVRPSETVDIEVAGTDPDYLLFDWLGELLYLFDTRRLLLSEFDVQVSPGGIRATARGERFDPLRHRLLHEVKAVTYHGLFARRVAGGWEAEVIVDI